MLTLTDIVGQTQAVEIGDVEAEVMLRDPDVGVTGDSIVLVEVMLRDSDVGVTGGSVVLTETLELEAWLEEVAVVDSESGTRGTVDIEMVAEEDELEGTGTL